MSTSARPPNPLIEVVRHFWDLGFTSFGGPGVHVVILRKRFVDRLQWLDATTFADLFALGNALPGPGSTQLAFSIAVAKHGTLAGLLAFLIWSLPGAAAMAAIGAAVKAFPDELPAIVLALFTGLNSAAVGLIALAAMQLARGAITDRLTRIIVLGSASFGICYHAPWMYPTLVVCGGLLTLVFDYRAKIWTTVVAASSRRSSARRQNDVRQDPDGSNTTDDIELEALPSDQAPGSAADQAADRNGPSDDNGADKKLAPTSSSASIGLRSRAAHTERSAASSSISGPAGPVEVVPDTQRQAQLQVPGAKAAVLSGLLFVLLVVVLVVVRALLRDPPRLLDFLTNMVIAGVTIFGGGPVVIPLLRGYTVDYGWIEPRDFLLGFAVLQAMPGPNFNFAVYLGILSNPTNPVLGAFLGWFGIFAPGILAKLALLPLYNRWRKFAPAKSVLRGLNAAAAGLVFTAVWQLFLVGYIYTPATGEAPATSTAGPLTSDPWWGVILAWSFTAVEWFNLAPAFAILLGGCAGLAWYGVTSS
ncbi:uncharacterized protein PFL1_05794 [Pseudozyma flocculosa PF-1]|uniref:Chromate transporter n=1 Tax=Pseudozyma flocculosa PF-1 TaxID=1277687 RepID=A0A061H1I4_9BASI|nr:uncharacterized protein PFL1_05794 [Pseudozyma flocculosa PF-1]EPQ26472.1 hypothetical protein PFL1_05794 [Pseudozyma flocculosa PF-1]